MTLGELIRELTRIKNLDPRNITLQVYRTNYESQMPISEDGEIEIERRDGGVYIV